MESQNEEQILNQSTQSPKPKKKVWIIVGVLAILLLVGGGYYYLNKDMPKKEDTVKIMNTNQPLERLLNSNVNLEGKTANVKAGAIFLVRDYVIYIEGLDFWPENLVNKQTTVSGKLVFKKYLPEAKIDEKGLWSQGVERGSIEVYVLEDAKFEIK